MINHTPQKEEKIKKQLVQLDTGYALWSVYLRNNHKLSDLKDTKNPDMILSNLHSLVYNSDL